MFRTWRVHINNWDHSGFQFLLGLMEPFRLQTDSVLRPKVPGEFPVRFRFWFWWTRPAFGSTAAPPAPPPLWAAAPGGWGRGRPVSSRCRGKTRNKIQPLPSDLWPVNHFLSNQTIWILITSSCFTEHHQKYCFYCTVGVAPTGRFFTLRFFRQSPSDKTDI